MSGRNRNGTWAVGHGPALGRGIRNKHVKEIYEDANAHWNEIEPTSGKRKGLIALELTFREKPEEYLRWQRSLSPRNYEHSVIEPEPDEVEDMLQVLRQPEVLQVLRQLLRQPELLQVLRQQMIEHAPMLEPVQ